MTYLQPRTKPRSRARAGIVVAVVVIAVAAFGIQFVRPHFWPSVFMTLAKPFWRAQLSVELGSLSTPEGLLQENAFLQRELDAANVRLQTVQSVEDENTQLRSLIGRASTTPYAVAAVLRRPPVAAYDELVLDAGADQGFKTGDLVLASGNVPIGRISDVLGDTSKVTLFSSSGQTYDVLIGPSRTPATAVGRGGGQYLAELPHGVVATPGDIVVAPSIDPEPFGTVVSVDSDPAQPFETIYFAPSINIYGLAWVLVDIHGQI